MKKMQLLDCTLRDGAYIVDAKFGVPAIKGMIKEIDPQSFVVIVDAHQTYGDGFKAFPD